MREGKRGRGSANKTPFVAAVSVNEKGHPIAMNMNVVNGFRSKEIARWAKRHLSTGSHVVSDGLACFTAVKEAGCLHTSIVTGMAVADCVEDGTIPAAEADDLFVSVGVFIHWAAEDDAKIQQYNYEATKEALKRAVAVAGTPTATEVGPPKVPPYIHSLLTKKRWLG